MLNLDLRLVEAAVGELEFFQASEVQRILSLLLIKRAEQITTTSASTAPDNDNAAPPSERRVSSSAGPPNQHTGRLRGSISTHNPASSASMEGRARVPRSGSIHDKGQAPPWLVGMAPSFYKDLDGVDRKLQGRILLAVAELAREVLQPQGDTIKPLTGTYKACWRYRIGNYRLIFLPDFSRASITLLAFASRGSVYED